MILDGFRQEPDCRRDPALEVEGHGGENGSKVLQRKRMDIWRRRSVSDGDLILCDDLKKRRSVMMEKAAKIIIEGRLLLDLPENDAGCGRSGVLPYPRHGAASSIGRRKQMEDVVAVELDFMRRDGKRYDFYGVYDGHGGRRVAQACGEMLHKVVVGAAGEVTGEEVEWRKVMAVGFKRMDEEVNGIGATVATVGTTAVVAVVGEEEVVVANCGDSRAVLSRDGVAVQLSDDHKPDRPDEVERIEASGGRVINWNGQRVMGVLATSRSIGDDYLKPFVTPEPEVAIMARSKGDEFLILASDGLWDVVSNDLACNVVRKCLQRSSHDKLGVESSWVHNLGSDTIETSAIELVELAMARGSQDNISVVVVKLDSFSS